MVSPMVLDASRIFTAESTLLLARHFSCFEPDPRWPVTLLTAPDPQLLTRVSYYEPKPFIRLTANRPAKRTDYDKPFHVCDSVPVK